MSIEPNLVQTYENNFEQFMKLQFKKQGKVIKYIKYVGGSK